MTSQPIYLDYHSTTPCDPRVVEAMLPFFTADCGNPSNSLNIYGRRARSAIEDARQHVAALIGARPTEVVFTSGATESNNLAILGLAHRFGDRRRKIVTSPIEHKSILETCHNLVGKHFEVKYLPVDATGRVDLAAAAEVIDENTLLVSLQLASNEIGTIQPVAEIAEVAHSKGVVVHSDAAQAVGRITTTVTALGVDLLSLSGHKLYGPKGVGALYVRGGASTAKLAPLALGGGQEVGLRPGTENVPAIVGLGRASAISRDEMGEEAIRVGSLRDQFEAHVFSLAPEVRRNGNLRARLPGNSSLTFPGVSADALLLNVPELALSTGSACTSGVPGPSHVLSAIGLSREMAASTVRIGIGRFTTAQEVMRAASRLANAYTWLVNDGREKGRLEDIGQLP